MNPEVKALWIDKLLTPGLPQTRGALNRTQPYTSFQDNEDDIPVGFCCLGVLCEVAVEQGVIEPGVASSLDNSRVQYIDERSYLPAKVMDWAGMNDHTGKFWDESGYQTLSGLNDAGCTFSEIADIIKEHF